MTNRSETPARTAKRVRINKDDNNVIEIPVETESAPSIAARNHVKAAVESHPNAIQRIVLALAKDYIALKAKYQQKASTKTKLDDDTTFIPRSARVAFKLTAPKSIMETTEIKELNAAMEEQTKQLSEFCKKSIASVATLVNEGMKREIGDLFIKGISQLSALLLTNHDPYQKEQPSDLFSLYILADMDQSLFDETFTVKSTLQTTIMNKLQDNSDGPATQQTIVYPPELLGPFALLRPIAQQLLTTVFVASITQFKNKMKENDTKKCLERVATNFLTGEATTAAAMIIDSEPSADPKTIRNFVNKAVQEKTAKMNAELQKLRDAVKRPPAAKNTTRGATSSSTTSSAPSPKKKEGNVKTKRTRKTTKKKKQRRQQAQTTYTQKTTRTFGRAKRKRFAKKQKAKETAYWDTIQKTEGQTLSHSVQSVVTSALRLYERHYGFTADPSLHPNENAPRGIASMPTWYYFQRPTNLSSHDLTSQIPPPPNWRSLLGLGLSFCPQPDFTPYNLRRTKERFQDNLFKMCFYAGMESSTAFDPTLYVKSSRSVPLQSIPTVVKTRTNKFFDSLKRHFKKKKCSPNLLPSQHRCLEAFKSSPHLMVMRTDKNLGPAAIEKREYIRLAFTDHLNDCTTYQRLSPASAANTMERAVDQLEQWLVINRDKIPKRELKYIKSTCH